MPMRRTSVLPTTILATVLVTLAAHAQQKAQFLLPFSTSDGTPVTTVSPADITIFEDGKQARVLSVEPRDRPLNVTLSVDNGRMLADALVHVRTQAKAFFEALPEGAEASLVTIAPQGRYLVRNSKNREALLKAVDTIAPDGSPGRFVEGLRDVAATWAKGSPDTNFVLVAFGSTYAAEFGNSRQLAETYERFERTRGTVHVVLFRPAGATEGDAQSDIGRQVASRTRGQFHDIGSHLQLPVIATLGKEIATSAGGGRTFLVTLERPEGAKGTLGALSISTSGGLKPGRITRLR